MKRPILVIIDGPMGAGKTSIGKALRNAMGDCALLSLDTIKKFIDYHNSEEKRRYFAKYVITPIIAKTYLKEGISVVIEKSIENKKILNLLIKNSLPRGHKLFVFNVNAPFEIRLKRVIERNKANKKEERILRKQLLSDSDSEDYRYDKEFDTSEESLDGIVKKIIKEVKR